jgi:hypothetical protein
MTDYKIIIEATLDELEKKINNKLANGYLLSGGVVMVASIEPNTGNVYCQAIYKP